jgi:hypothetical protein
MEKSMKIISYVSEENDKLYDVETMRKILGTRLKKGDYQPCTPHQLGHFNS